MQTPSWTHFNQQHQALLTTILAKVAKARAAGKKVYPPSEDTFAAFALCPFDTVKLVIIGQDPYHGPNQAMGLAFSVPEGQKLPPSLKNIYKELQNDLGLPPPVTGNLKPWAQSGVLLLNAALTVEAGEPQSHANIGWHAYTDAAIAYLNQHPEPIVFLLWGAYAQKKTALIDSDKHHLLTAAHPSPLSAYRGFFGCQHFSKANQLLTDAGRQPVDFSL